MNMRFLISAAALLIASALPAFAQTGTINSLTAGSALAGTEKIPMAQAADPANAVYTTPAAVSTFVNAHLPTGTSGATVPLNNGGFTQSGTVNFTGTFQVGGFAMTFPGSAATLGHQSGAWTSGHCLQAASTTGAISDAGAICGSGGSGISQLTGDVTAGPGSGSQVATLANTAVTPAVYGDSTHVAQVTVDAKGRLTLAANVAISGASGWELTDGTTDLTGTTKVTVSGMVVGGTAGAATLAPTNKTTNHTTSVTAANIGGQDDYNGASLTATLSTLGAGQTNFVSNQGNSALTIALAGQTVNGVPLNTLIDKYGFCSYTGLGSSTIDAFCFPGYVTITPGALVKFNDAAGGFTAADLSGACTTSGSLVTTCPIQVVPTASGSGSATLSGNSNVYVCTSTCSVTMPTPAAGIEACVRNAPGVSTVITMVALGGSRAYEKTDNSGYGTAGTGTLLSGGAIGDKICLHGLDATHYLVGSFNGTWAAS